METMPLFNGSIATTQRIDSLLVYGHAANIRKKIDLIQSVLIELYKELYPFLNENEKKEGDNRYQEAKNIGNKKPNEQLDILDFFDLYIRAKLNQKGLLMAKGDDPGRAFS